MNKYFIYCRRSSEHDDIQVLSIESQIRELTRLAKRLKLSVLDILTESKSAKAPERKTFNEMIRRIYRKEATGIICWKLDRLARNPIDGGQISWMLQQGIIKHIQTAERSYYPEDNVLLMNVEFGMANQFILDLSKNTKRGLKTKVEKGWLPGIAPLGYLNNKNQLKGEKSIVKDSERFPLVRKMWDLMLTGNHSLREIAKMANEKWGFRMREFKRHGGGPLLRERLYKVFTDPFYSGTIRYNGELYAGKHEAMISKEEFARVQSLLGKNARPRTKLHAFPFRGIIQCGECGSFITAEEKHRETKSGLHRYIYYHCTKRKRNVRCSQPSINKEELEGQIKKELSKIAIDEDFKNLALKYLRKIHHQETKNRASIQSSLEKRYKDTQGQINSLTDMRVKKLVDDEEYLEHKNRFLLEREKLKERIDDTRHGADRWLELSERAFTFACYANYWFEQGTLEEKNTILRTIGSNFLLKDRNLTIELKNPWIILKKDLKKQRWQIEGLELSQIPTSSGLEPALSPVSFVPGAGRC